MGLRILDIVDAAVVWAMTWAAITWFRATPARLPLVGLGMLAAFYLVAVQLELVLTTWILQGFAAVAVLVAVVVFQEDLRRIFERLASFWLRRGPSPASLAAVDLLTRCLVTLAAQRRGALVVIGGKDSLGRHARGGVELDAKLSEPLLLSIFDPHSPGHDGAVIVDGERVRKFAVHLPLSTDRDQLLDRGTRHAAALGLAERTDALCVVVSEERGTVSAALGGRIETFTTPGAVGSTLRTFLGQQAPATEPVPWAQSARFKEALYAFPIAIVLWILAVPGGQRVEVDRDVQVGVTGLPPNFELSAVDPETVSVRLAGRRRDLYFIDPRSLQVTVDALYARDGRRTYQLSEANISIPESVDLVGIEPEKVRLDLRTTESP